MSLFDGTTGKILVGAIGVLVGVIVAYFSRIGKAKADNIRRKTKGIL